MIIIKKIMPNLHLLPSNTNTMIYLIIICNDIHFGKLKSIFRPLCGRTVNIVNTLHISATATMFFFDDQHFWVQCT